MEINSIITQLQAEHDEIKKEYEVVSKKAEAMRNKLNSLDGAIANLRNAYAPNVSYGLNGVDKHSLEKPIKLESEVHTDVDFSKRGHFEEAIIMMLKEKGLPLTAPQLQDFYNELASEEQEKDRSTFSGMLSHTVKKSDKFNRIELPQIKGRSKFVYGLPHWFTDFGDLRAEYLSKIEQETDLFS